MENEENNDSDIPISNDPEIPNSEIPEIEKEQIVDSDLSEILIEMLEKFDKTQEAITEFQTESGPIKVIHEITLGDLLVSTLLVAILIFNVFTQLIRRF